MKFLNADDKEFFAAIAAILLIIISLLVCIGTTIRAYNTTPKKYETNCIINYIKYPLKVCYYKEVK